MNTMCKETGWVDHKCDDDCQRTCELCNDSICNYENDSFTKRSGVYFCINCIAFIDNEITT